MASMTPKFFLIVPPGFEKLSLEELQEKWPIHFPNELPSIDLKTGGIEVSCEIEYGMALNLILKIPTRILLRIESFKCRDFPKLYQKILKVNWNIYLLGKVPSISASSKNSRIFDSRKIEKCFNDGILEFFKRQPPKKKFLEAGSSSLPFSIFVRFENDECTISIDTSGEPLYKRGTKILTSNAPIRENLAAGLLFYLKKHLKNPIDTLIDPMCGSGTFLFESKNFYKLSDQRAFNFKLFPLMEKIKFPQFKPKESGLFENHLGFDIDEKMVETAGKNLGIPILKRDVYAKITPMEYPNVIIVNPPYGKRLEEKPNFKSLIKVLKENYSPELIGIIIPADIKINLGKKLSFKNGGIKVNFWVFKP